VLPLWQPWASWVALNLKLKETRSWSTPYMNYVGAQGLRRLESVTLLAAISQQIGLEGGKG
jgi:hypothetical protein